MNRKLKQIFTNVRVIIFLVVLLLAVVAIHPSMNAEGVTIRNVAKNSSAEEARIESPSPTARPMAREVIHYMNNKEIKTIQDYNNFVSTLDSNRTVRIKTNKNTYTLVTRPLLKETVLNETEIITVTETLLINKTINGSKVQVNETRSRNVTQNKILSEVIGVQDIGLSIYDAPSTNLKKGLDLQGGTRVLLQPEKKLTDDEMGMLLENMKYRLNVYGLSDIVVREAGDLSGNQFIVVEIAGATETEVKNLLSQQGKFESKIGNETVFMGGGDIRYVCRSADCSGIDTRRGCGQMQDAWVCRFMFSITISPEAAQRQADATRNLQIVKEGSEEYLSDKIRLYLDDSQVDELNIASDLRGKAITDIAISGSGTGATQQAAMYDAVNNMKKLQTVMITGSLPVKLNIVKTDAISPALGNEFLKNAILMGIFASLAIVVIVFLRYRKLSIVVPMVIIVTAETIIMLGVASIVGWNLDLAAIAGIIAAIGTGVDDQIVITDEALRGSKTSEIVDWKKRFKNAFFIVIAAFFTTTVAMIPLLFAGAGLLKGFAITTIIGISIGVFITRPAFAQAIEILLKE